MAPRRSARRGSGSGPSLLELQAASRPARARRRAAADDPGLIWLTRLGSLLALGACLWFLGLLQRDVEAGQYGTIETDRAHLARGPGWFDPRWEQELSAALAGLGPLEADDRRSIESVGDRVARLSFVSEVGAPRVVWPDGLRLDLKLREPIACLVAPPGRQYATISVDGVVLSGRWSAPPDRGSGYLPLIWSAESYYLEPGERLGDPAVVDGLAVAAAMWRELPPTVLARLGRVVIDARRSRQTSPEEPGTRILLEGGREVIFGRSPNLDAPGETPVHLKLRALARALEPDVPAWVLVDVRWDRPEILVREDLEDPGEGGEGGNPGPATGEPFEIGDGPWHTGDDDDRGAGGGR